MELTKNYLELGYTYTTDLNVGDLAELLEENPGEVILVAYNVIISLTNPRHTWTRFSEERPNFKVKRLRSGDSITLIQD